MTNNIPSVSVVLPTYNQAAFLPKALDGVFQQTWRDFELIVVNDGSSDTTPQVLEEYRQKYDFTVIHQENQKLPRALNTGFRAARGYYLTWTSSDNVMLPNMLEEMVKALEANSEIGLVYADWEVIDEKGSRIDIVHTLDYDRHLLMRINFINACFLYRRLCQEKIGLYDPDYILAEDWEYWLRISRSFKLMRVPMVLYQYRYHGKSLTDTDVLHQPAKAPPGYLKLLVHLQSYRIDWYVSKLKWEWLRFKLGQDPRTYIRPQPGKVGLTP
jgi:glycosyltransferase involved in cell wall biosynthesis